MNAHDRLVRRVDRVLKGRVSRRRRRKVRQELEANLNEAAEDVGSEEAIRRLGDLRALTTAYLDAQVGRIDLKAGGWAGLAVLWAVLAAGQLVALAFARGVEAAGGATTALQLRLWPFTVFYTPLPQGGFGVSAHPDPLALVAFAAVGVLVTGRVWRLVLRGRAAPIDPPPPTSP